MKFSKNKKCIFKKKPRKKKSGGQYSSVAEHLPSKYQNLGLISSRKGMRKDRTEQEETEEEERPEETKGARENQNLVKTSLSCLSNYK